MPRFLPTWGWDQGTGYNQNLWYIWNGNPQMTTGSTATIYDQWWYNGTAVTQVTNGGLYHNYQIWNDWSTANGGAALSHEYELAEPPPPPSEEELRYRAMVRARNDLIYRNRARTTALRHRVASRKAEELLLDNLTEEQADEYRRLQRFAVVIGDRTYRIRKGMHGNLDVIEDDRVIERLCVYARGGVPEQDNMLAQKLLLETDEEHVRRTANITRMRVAA